MNTTLTPDIFAASPVLVIGDVMLDRYQWGEVKRISPEAPVPVVKALDSTEVPGGAGNVAANLAGLGCPVCLIALCGDDDEGNRLKRILDAKGIDTVLQVDASRSTTTKTRVMANNQQLFRLDREQTEPMTPAVAQQVIGSFKDRLHTYRAVVMSDYGKGLFNTPEVGREIISMANEAGVPVIVDPKGRDWNRYRGATCVTPNTAELALVSGTETDGDEQALAACAASIRKRFDLESLLVTRGPDGMCLVKQDNHTDAISADAREVFDVSGAGDTVIATLAAALAAGFAISEAARIANAAAGVVVAKLGTQPISFPELDAALKTADKHGAKRYNLDAAIIQTQSWRAAGQKIVFTNGCFDLLHPGHIDLLNQASSFGDHLIVGLNTDASVKRLKGSGRPILSEHDRAAILGALESVTMVVLFDEETPLALIEALRPDVLVKGADYRPDEVAGREVVESYGGELRLVKLLEGYSTTNIANRFPGDLDH